MENTAYQDEFLVFLQKAILWFKKRATRAQWAFNGLRILLIILAATLPALASHEDMKTWTTIVAVIIAILTGVETLFKPGDQWKQHRSTQLALLAAKRQYHFQIEKKKSDPKSTDKEAFDILHEGVEKILREEAATFWGFRITKPSE